MASRFKTVNIEEVTKLKEAAENLAKTLAKMYALNENCILLNVLGFRYNEPVKTITVVSVICHPRH